MISSRVDYVAPESVDEALAELAASGGAGRVLAGGQSLIPTLRTRMALPTKVVDLGRIEVLSAITPDADHVVIGALATHGAVLRSDLVVQHARLLHDAVAEVADPQVRNRGTVGGALVHADPASDVGVAALALGAELVIAGAGGVTRTVAAEDFFVEAFESAVRDDELLTQVRIPKHTGWGAHYEKFVGGAHQWAVVAVAAMVRVSNGFIAEARIGMANMGPTPLRATNVEQALVGRRVTDVEVRAAVESVADGTNPPSGLNGDADYRRHLAKVLTRRAVLLAAGG